MWAPTGLGFHLVEKGVEMKFEQSPLSESVGLSSRFLGVEHDLNGHPELVELSSGSLGIERSLNSHLELAGLSGRSLGIEHNLNGHLLVS